MMNSAAVTNAVDAISTLAAQVAELRAALRWCLEEGLDEYVHETELQRLTEYNALLSEPLRHPKNC